MNPARQPYKFLADATGLDYLNALARPEYEGDAIANGESLLRWIEEADLVPAGALETLKAKALPAELDSTAACALALGEWFRGFVLEHKGNSLLSSAVNDLAPLNQLLKRDIRIGRVEARDTLHERIGGSGLKWSNERTYDSLEMLLMPIAEAMAELICVEDFRNVRSCEGAKCDLLFLDRTRGRARRWCRMALCGNRAKQATRRSTQAFQCTS
jgi:predicted RNA-binding Zn ribbon-like protein